MLKIEHRIGDWFETYSGKQFYPLDARLNEIDITDIAHALSLLTRFGGHGNRFYSVAQHSLNVMEAMAADGYSEDLQLKGLLHDASEAYIADIVSPAKRFMPEYKEIEAKLQNKIWERFGLTVTEYDEDVVKFYDLAMLGLEASEMMSCKHWNIENTYLIDLKKKQTLEVIRMDLEDMKEVEKRFLDSFNFLTYKHK